MTETKAPYSTKPAGASKSSSAATSGNGAVVVAAGDNPPMVENSATSTQTGKPRTKRAANLTAEQALQILQQSVLNCQQAGINCQIATLHDSGDQMIAVVLRSVVLANGNLVIASTGKGGEA